MKREITLIQGDGIGPEVIDSAIEVIESAGVEIDWVSVQAGMKAMELYGTPLPAQVIRSIKKTKVAFKGPITTPIGAGYSSVNVALRKALNLYVNLRPVKSIPGVKAQYKDLDLVIIRENTEDLYSGIEHVVAPGVVESVKIITAKASRRIAQFAFKYAEREGRARVTAIHKANIMKISDGLFLKSVKKECKKNPKIKCDDMLVDNACMQLVLNPRQFDILLLENLYGDIISDLCAGLVGGLGVVPGVNLGRDCAMFESVHGTAPDIAGKNIANPIAAILSGILLLKHIGDEESSDRVFKALIRVLKRGNVLTRDLGGKAKTTEFTKAVIREIRR